LRALGGVPAAVSAFLLAALFSGVRPAGGPGSAYGPSAFADPPGHVPRDGRAFYLPCQYSSFADDTALYTLAYRDAERSMDRGKAPGGAVPGEPVQAGRTGTIRAGTISHHLFIRNLIAEYFVTLARNVHPATIILLGPNHHARGHSAIALSALPWRTPFGFLRPDSVRIRRISETGLASVEEEGFLNEHSIGALAPFIRRTFPGTRIVPIIFKKGADRCACEKLAGVIAGLADSALVLASLDFSHYRTNREAQREDAASLDVLHSLSGDRVGEAFVDSRPALLTLMTLCRRIDARTVDVVQHTNSGILSRNPRAACTSYINSLIRN
jgi:AmmeMemoRadiSam system protein B